MVGVLFKDHLAAVRFDQDGGGGGQMPLRQQFGIEGIVVVGAGGGGIQGKANKGRQQQPRQALRLVFHGPSSCARKDFETHS